MTDMHREAFEKWFWKAFGDSLTSDSIQYRYAKVAWLAVLRYRNEQEKQA